MEEKQESVNRRNRLLFPCICEQSSWHWFITSRFCYICYLHPSKNCLGFAWFWGNILCLEDKMLEAIGLIANKFDLGNGNLNYTHSIHPFCGLCHFCVPGHLGWWSKELLVYLGVAVSPSSSFCLHFPVCSTHQVTKLCWCWAKLLQFQMIGTQSVEAWPPQPWRIKLRFTV